jgi:predicted HicB family RNase H-like nuclease
MLEYKGYAGKVEFDPDEGIFHGEVIDLRDVITFQGTTVDEIERAFRDSVDDYLDYCQDLGGDPDRPFSGRFMLRLPPSVHRKAYVNAAREGKSLNQWIADRLASEV